MGAALALSLLPSHSVHLASRPVASSTGWTTYHKDSTRNGYDSAASAFPAGGSASGSWTTSALDGTNYAEPLALNGRIFQATTNNSIYAFDELTGNQVWYWHKYAAVSNPAAAVGCGNINPVGIVSTPVIDPSLGLIYAVGIVSAGSVDKYQLFTVDLSTGTEAFAPIDINTSVVDPVYDEQRASIGLAPNGRMIYVPFGGWVGDCVAADGHAYHPIVVAVPVGADRGMGENTYQPQTAGQTRAGIWGPSGVAIDANANVYVSTGNGSENNCSNPWDHSEGVMKLSATVVEVSNWFRTDWCTLNAADNDIGSLGPMIINGGTEIVQSGKPGDWDLLNTSSLGGIGGQVAQGHVDSCPTTDAVFGGMAYAAPYVYIPCDNTGLIALQENTSVTPHTFTMAWKSALSFTPTAPIVAGGVVWTMGNGNLYGFDAVTGAQHFALSIGGHTRFATPTEDNGWLIVPESNTVKAFTFNGAGLGGVLASEPDAASWASGRLDVFLQGQDRALWHRAWNGTAWQGWESLGGVMINDSGAVSGAANSIDVIVRGQDNGLYRRHFDGTTWAAWESLGGRTIDGPDISSWGATRLDMFVRGQDNGLWHKWWDGTTWSAWEDLGGVITSATGAVSSAANSLDVCARGQDNALWCRHWNGTTWGAWTGLGGVLWSGPELSSCAAGKLDVFIRGQDSAIWRRSFDGTNWGAWVSVGGYWTSGAGAVCQPTTTKIDLFMRGSDMGLWQVELPN